jgi:hypothetical protein
LLRWKNNQVNEDELARVATQNVLPNYSEMEHVWETVGNIN